MGNGRVRVAIMRGIVAPDSPRLTAPALPDAHPALGTSVVGLDLKGIQGNLCNKLRVTSLFVPSNSDVDPCGDGDRVALEGLTMKRPGDTRPDPPGGRAAERLREFEAARCPPKRKTSKNAPLPQKRKK